MEHFIHFIFIFYITLYKPVIGKMSVQTFVTLTLLCVIECIYIDKVQSMVQPLNVVI